jgi:hypothetical protein
MTLGQLGARFKATERKKLELAARLLDEVLAGDDQIEARDAGKNGHAPVFNRRCSKCQRPIMWAATENANKAALDERPGAYVLTDGGTAIFQGGFAGYGYHYDGTPEGCPGQQVSAEAAKQDDPPRRREWQDVYD